MILFLILNFAACLLVATAFITIAVDEMQTTGVLPTLRTTLTCVALTLIPVVNMIALIVMFAVLFLGSKTLVPRSMRGQDPRFAVSMPSTHDRLAAEGAECLGLTPVPKVPDEKPRPDLKY